MGSNSFKCFKFSEYEQNFMISCFVDKFHQKMNQELFTVYIKEIFIAVKIKEHEKQYIKPSFTFCDLNQRKTKYETIHSRFYKTFQIKLIFKNVNMIQSLNFSDYLCYLGKC